MELFKNIFPTILDMKNATRAHFPSEHLLDQSQQQKH